MDEIKIAKSIEAFKIAEKIAKDFYNRPLVVTYSGGKDSDVLLDLVLKSGVEFEVSHSVTTVDAPQTNRHVNKVFARLREQGITAYKMLPQFKGESINMFDLIVKRVFHQPGLLDIVAVYLRRVLRKIVWLHWV